VQEYTVRPREVALEAINNYLAEHPLKPGDRLPSEREMCELWSLNRSTLRSALSRLERDGVLDVRQGAGIFIPQPKFTRNLQDLKSFAEEAAHQGRGQKSRVLSLCRIECDKQFSRRFQVMLGTPLWRLSRLRTIDEIPTMIETSFFLAERFPDIDRYDFSRESLFHVFETQYQAGAVRGEEKISTTQVSEEEAALLEVADNAPAFWIVSQTYDTQGELLEYCRTVARADRLILTSILERRETS